MNFFYQLFHQTLNVLFEDWIAPMPVTELLRDWELSLREEPELIKEADYIVKGR